MIQNAFAQQGHGPVHALATLTLGGAGKNFSDIAGYLQTISRLELGYSAERPLHGCKSP